MEVLLALLLPPLLVLVLLRRVRQVVERVRLRHRRGLLRVLVLGNRPLGQTLALALVEVGLGMGAVLAALARQARVRPVLQVRQALQIPTARHLHQVHQAPKILRAQGAPRILEAAKMLVPTLRQAQA